MQRGWKLIFILVGILAIVLIAEITRYKPLSFVLGSLGIKDIKSENYCHQYGYAKCPLTCDVGPSCPMCMDIGCHAKQAHWGKSKINNYSK